MVLVAICAAAAVHRAVSSRLALREFDETHLIASPEFRRTAATLQTDQEIDFSLWSKGRVAAYRDDPVTKNGSPLAVLRFERVKLRVPVFAGTDEWTLNRGAGWIAGTARPGEAGNIGIAAHRDSFFRVLKDIRSGDTIELISVAPAAAYAARTATYTVSQVEIVDPDDVSVLQPRREPSLTLVTCYPFYFVGPAPRRFIVHAALRKQAGIEEFAN
jgi:sortase A